MTDAASPMTVTTAMFNAPFIGTVVVAAADGYASERDGAPMPLPLAFIAAPLVLDARTRQALPRSITTHMVDWIDRNPGVRAAFPERAAQLVDVVRAGLRWALRVEAVRLEDGAIRAARTVRTGAPALPVLDSAAHSLGLSVTDPDAADILRAARLTGRWLTKNENTSTTFALLGVRP